MTRESEGQRDANLLAQMRDTLPPAASSEQHRNAVRSLLALFESIHVEGGVPLPGWLLLGKQLYPEAPQDDPTRTQHHP